MPKPVILISQQNQAHDKTLLTCEVTLKLIATLNISIRWFKKGEYITSKQYFRNTTEEVNRFEASIPISALLTNAAGIYQCTVDVTLPVLGIKTNSSNQTSFFVQSKVIKNV